MIVASVWPIRLNCMRLTIRETTGFPVGRFIVTTISRGSKAVSPGGPGSTHLTAPPLFVGRTASRTAFVKNGGAVTPLTSGHRQKVASR